MSKLMERSLSTRHVVHLIRRAATSLSNRAPSAIDRKRAETVLRSAEFELWSSMSLRDQRHSLVVLDRFMRRIPDASREIKAAALLHDVGKSVSDLGWLGRVIATVVGPRTTRFATYHDHELIGVELISGVSAQQTIAMLSGEEAAVKAGLGREHAALMEADNV